MHAAKFEYSKAPPLDPEFQETQKNYKVWVDKSCKIAFDTFEICIWRSVKRILKKDLCNQSRRFFKILREIFDQLYHSNTHLEWVMEVWSRENVSTFEHMLEVKISTLINLWDQYICSSEFSKGSWWNFMRRRGTLDVLQVFFFLELGVTLSWLQSMARVHKINWTLHALNSFNQ